MISTQKPGDELTLSNEEGTFSAGAIRDTERDTSRLTGITRTVHTPYGSGQREETPLTGGNVTPVKAHHASHGLPKGREGTEDRFLCPLSVSSREAASCHRIGHLYHTPLAARASLSATPESDTIQH